MAATDALPAVRLAADDVPDALALSAEAGWNQVAADWRLMIGRGEALGVRDDAGRLVASALALPYPPEFGWISMVLVTAPWRRRGIASALLRQAMAALAARRLTPVLDATPAGRRVYEPLGFRAVEALARWRGPAGEGRPPAPGVRPAGAGDLETIAALDAAAFGAARPAIIADIAGRPDAIGLVAGEPAAGFVLCRRGRTALQIGPLVADDDAVAERLLVAAIGAATGAVVIDLPDREITLAARLRSLGFRIERPFTRMALGRDRPYGRPSAVRAVAGPELG